jgi:hypothetical protein
VALEDEKYIGKRIFGTFMYEIFDNLIFRDNNKWKKTRKTLSNMFNFN